MYTESDTAKYFKDTWFGAHPDAWEKIGKYPVLHLIMPTCPDTIEKFSFGLQVAIAKATGHDIVSGRSPSDDLTLSILRINKDTGKNVVVLIDEYDQPLISCLSISNVSENYIEMVRKMLHDFYHVLKDSEKIIQKCIITGSSRLAKTAMFTGILLFFYNTL